NTLAIEGFILGGTNNTVGGTDGFAVGNNNIVNATNGGAHGHNNSIGTGTDSQAFGAFNTINVSNASYAFGIGETIAGTGDNVALGVNSTVSGSFAVTVGSSITASAVESLTMGLQARDRGNRRAFVVGNGGPLGNANPVQFEDHMLWNTNTGT